MIDKLREAALTYEEIRDSLSDPETAKDRAKYAHLMRKFKSMTPLMDEFHVFEKAEKDIKDAEGLLAVETDPEMRQMISEELLSAQKTYRESEDKLKILLLPRDEDDDRNIIVEIRAGAGGEEAALFAYDLYRMYSMYAASCGYKCEINNANETELGGFKEISFTVSGESVYSRFKFESGVHRVQRVPETESQGRIQTSTVTVAVLPEIEELDDTDIVINPADITVETCKSSGAGGQHINKTESAIRIIHKPSGIVVWCQSQRSQTQNKEYAMNMLRTKLYNIAKEERDGKLASERKSQVGSGDRSEKIRTYNYPQGRITDHRIGFSVYSLDNFMNGNIGDMIDALIAADTAEKLKNSGY